MTGAIIFAKLYIKKRKRSEPYKEINTKTIAPDEENKSKSTKKLKKKTTLVTTEGDNLIGSNISNLMSPKNTHENEDEKEKEKEIEKIQINICNMLPPVKKNMRSPIEIGKIGL